MTIADAPALRSTLPDQAEAQFDRVLRLRFVLLALLAGCAAVLSGGRGDWNQFVDTGRAMFGSSGVHVFVDHPEVQTGPLNLALTAALSVTPRAGFPAAAVIVALCGLVILVLLERCGRVRVGDPAALGARTLLGGLMLLGWWAQLGRFGHLDDAIVLTLAVGALVLAERGGYLPAAVLVGLAAGFKPWAVIFVGLCVPPRPPAGVVDAEGPSPWSRWVPPLVAAATSAVWWLPFLVGDRSTISSLRPTVLTAPDSVLRLMGLVDAVDSPGLRLGQLAIAASAGVFVASRGRRELVIAVAVAVRIAIDPGTWSYYTAGVMVGLLAWAWLSSSRVVPWSLLLASLLLAPEWLVGDPDLRAFGRLVVCVAVVVGAGLAATRRTAAATTG